MPREDKGRAIILQKNTAGNQRPSAVIPLLEELGLTEHANVDLRRYLKRICGLMLVIPPADWLDVSSKVREELLSSGRYMLTELARIVPFPSKTMWFSCNSASTPSSLKKSTSLSTSESRNSNAATMFLRTVSLKYTEIITAALQHPIDDREVALHVPQFGINAPEV